MNIERVYVNQFNTATDRNLLPLAAGMITSHARKHVDAEFEIKVLRNDIVETVDWYEAPNVLAFSCYVWNLKHSLAVAEMAKRRFPEAKIVVGGPSIPRKGESIQAFLTRYHFVDVLVHGEGDIAFTEVLSKLKGDCDLSEVLGISFRNGDQVVTTSPRTRILSLDELPSPYLDGTFDELLRSHRGVITGTIWETNRGCPFSCTFCDWGQATQTKINMYGMERLYAELEWISQNKIFYIYAADANFGIKKRDIDIAGKMAELKAKYGFPGYFMINWTKNSHQKTIEIAETLKTGGIGFQVTLSMQSFDKETLRAIKRDNIDLDTFRSLKREYNRREISTYSELLLGLPGETYNSFASGVIRALSPFPRDHFNIYLVRILENSEMAENEYRRSHGIQTTWCEVAMARRANNNSTVYEDEEIVISTSAMSVEDWRKAFSFGYTMSLLYNLRIGHIIINYLRYALGLNPRHYVEFLLQTHSDGFFQEVRDVLVSFQDSIIAGKSSVLRVEGYGERYWEPHEAVFLVVQRDPEAFYESLQSLTEVFIGTVDKSLISELFNFQKCLLQRYGVFEETVTFSHNWLHFYRNMHAIDENSLIRKRSTYRFSRHLKDPELTPADYAISLLSTANSESDSGCLIKDVQPYETVVAH